MAYDRKGKDSGSKWYEQKGKKPGAQHGSDQEWIRSERPSGAGRAQRPGGGSQSSRPARPGYGEGAQDQRAYSGDRPRRPEGSFHAEGGPKREGSFSREGGANREGGFKREGGFNREGGFKREGGFNQGGKPRSDSRYTPAGKGPRDAQGNGRAPYADRPARPEHGKGPARFERTDRSERSDRPVYSDRPARPSRPGYAPNDRGERRPRPAPVFQEPGFQGPGFAEEPDMPRENMLVGRNPIREALKSGRDMEKLLVARGDLSGSARELISMARERHIVVQEVDRLRLDALSPGHQGMVAFASAFRYSTVEDMLALAKERNQPPFLVVLDGITDPHNLGAIIRSAECAGAHGVIVAERRAVGLTPAAVKASAGAVEYLPVARVGNVARLIEQLKEQSIWTYAAVMDGERYDHCDLSGPVALVIGAEGEGISRLVLEKCDHRVALPICGRIDSLNASVAAGVLLYEVVRRRQP